MNSRADTAGTTTYTYDKAGRLATTADPLTGATLSYGYNANSQPTNIAYASSGTGVPLKPWTLPIGGSCARRPWLQVICQSPGTS
jgi:YD repeat-containing protein